MILSIGFEYFSSEITLRRYWKCWTYPSAQLVAVVFKKLAKFYTLSAIVVFLVEQSYRQKVMVIHLVWYSYTLKVIVIPQNHSYTSKSYSYPFFS